MGITSASLPVNLFLNLKDRVLNQWEKERKENRLQEKRMATDAAVDIVDVEEEEDILFHTMEMRDQLDHIRFDFSINLLPCGIYAYSSEATSGPSTAFSVSI